MKIEILINDETKTNELALLITKYVFPGFIIAMDGDLGAGKTTFAKSIAQGLKINKIIKSPTFNILKVYSQGELPFYHIDAYRLENIKQDLGFEEYIEGDGVTLIEWYKYINYLLPKDNYLVIEIKVIDENKRLFTLIAFNEIYKEIVREVEKIWKKSYI